MSRKKGALLPFLAALSLLLTTVAGPHSTVAQSSLPTGCWRVVPAANINGDEVNVTRLSVAPNNELWAISNGNNFANPPQGHPYVLQRNNGGWDSLPALPLTGTFDLPALKVFAASDVWVLVTFLTKGQSDATTLHWDGKAWQTVPIISFAPLGYAMSDLDGTSSSDLWIVGTGYSGPHNAEETGITFHYNGRQWRQETTPPVDNYVSLNRVLALSSQDVWAVGTKVLHWDGKQWQSVAPLNLTAEYQDLIALSPRNILAVGSNGTQSIIEGWDGQRSIVISAPNPGRNTHLQGISAAQPNDIWAVGNYDQDSLLVHFDGNNWTPIPDPVPGFSSGLTGIKAVGGEFWATGSRVINGSKQGGGFLLRYTNEPCPSSGPQKPLNPPVPVPGTGSQQFITGESASGIFLKYWQEHGGLQQQGYPISDVLGEQSDLDGHIYTVQYFERAAFEYHPELKGTPYEVLLAQLGTFQYKQKYPNGAPNQRANQDRGTLVFPETGKHLGGTFLKYWQEHGGLQQQGFPISEEFTEVSDLNGKPYTVQYFERAVFEWHPENTPPFNVLLSQLGHFRYFNKYTAQQSQASPPRRIADSILPNTLRGADNYLIWSDLRSPVNTPQTIYAYDASQNRELPISQSFPSPDGLPLATNGALAFWTRRDIDRRYLEGYNFQTGLEARLFQPSTVTSPDFRRSDIALDQMALYYTDNWPQHTGIFAQDLSTGNERQIYDKVPALNSLVAADGSLLWTQETTNGANTERTLRLYRADSGAVMTLASGIGAFAGYGVSGDYAVYSFYGTIANQTTYLYNIKTGARKVVAFGAASNPVILNNRVAWVRWPSAESGESDGWKIESYNINTGATTTLSSGLRTMPRSLVLLSHNRLAFAADLDLTTRGFELYLLDLTLTP
jgi:hypothetical protein